jgi:hypothetical protein
MNRQTIAAIDRKINAVRRELQLRLAANPDSSEAWQKAWDENPDLREKECELFRQRGEAQEQMAIAEQKKFAAKKVKYVDPVAAIAKEVCFSSDTAIRWLRFAADGIDDSSVKQQILTHCEFHEKQVKDLRKKIA